MTENESSAAAAGSAKERESTGTAPFTLANYLLFAGGLLDIVAGWFLLRAGSITIAPIMLILGYCGIVPLAIVYRSRTGKAEK